MKPFCTPAVVDASYFDCVMGKIRKYGRDVDYMV